MDHVDCRRAEHDDHQRRQDPENEWEEDLHRYLLGALFRTLAASHPHLLGLHPQDTGDRDAERVGLDHRADEGLELGDVGPLDVWWLGGYGGGVFLPLRDGSAGHTTYGGGRYLLDTVKGADLGARDGELILDFNFAYHPSCVYSVRWACPLSPPANALDVPIRAGERLR